MHVCVCVCKITYTGPSCSLLYMHGDYMPIRGVQGRIHIYNTDVGGGRKRGKIVGGRYHYWY